jgi:DNA repair protein RadC
MKQQERVAEIEVSYRPAIGRKPVIASSLDAFIELIEFFSPETIALQEGFMVMYVNRANRVLGVYDMAAGGITSTVLDLRLLLSVALKTAAVGIILCHNHPSSKLKPSSQDKDVTSKIKEACKYFDLVVLDHIIISPEREYYSFADEGLI